MTRIFLATTLALSLMATSVSSAPERAGNSSDLSRFLAGAVTLFIISKAIEESNRARPAPPKVTRPAKRWPVVPPRNAFRGYVPAECFFKVRTDKRRHGVYGKACVDELMYRPNRLPHACLDTVPVRHGRKAKVYDAKCLSKHGFRNSNWRG